MIFFKSGSQYIQLQLLILYARKLQIAISQNDFRNIFEKTMHGIGPKRRSYVSLSLMSFNKLISGIIELFFDFYGRKYAKNGQNKQSARTITFLPIKSRKIFFQKSLTSVC